MTPAPAKLTDRFLAYLVDLLPFFAGYFSSLHLLVVRVHALPNSLRAWRGIAAGWIFLYLLYQAAGNLSGGTLGKRLFGIRAVALDGEPLGVKRSVLRALGYFLSTPLMNLGFLWSLFEPQSRAWHDLLAGSVVVETREKSPAAAALSAGLSLAALAALGSAYVWLLFWRPAPQDMEAVRKAREGLRILAAIEEEHKAQTGAYTDRLADLARVSGDVETFRSAMGELFDEDSFQLSAGRDRYWIRGRAKDRRRTRVMIEGPPPR